MRSFSLWLILVAPLAFGAQRGSLPRIESGDCIYDVYRAVCNSWPVRPIDASTKRPFYSNVPVLLGAGGLDDACRPMYNDLIHHYFPNSQQLLFVQRLHGPLLNSLEGDVYIGDFLDKPFARIDGQKDILASH
jgi:hypothetical protein